MSYYKKGEPIGRLDDRGREICAGDNVIDEKGRRYTVDERGRAIMDGSNRICLITDFREVLITTLSADIRSAFREGPDGKVGPASPPPPPSPAPEPEPEKPADPTLAPKGKSKGGKPNKSGKVTISSLCQSAGRKSIAGVADALAAAGIPTEWNKNKNKRVIKIEDRDRALEIVRGLSVQVPKLVPADPPAPPADVKAPHISTRDPAYVFGKFDAYLLLTDQDLADELRRRGWSVTCTKSI